MLTASTLLQARDTPTEEDNLRLLAENYANNRDAFGFLKCRFNLIEGSARDLDAALRGDVSVVATQEIVWLVNGSKMKYEAKCILPQDAEPRVKSKPVDKVSEPCSPIAILFDGQRVLKYSQYAKGDNIWAPHVVSPEVRDTPFGLGIMGPDEQYGPAAFLRRCFAGEFSAVFEGYEVLEGRQVVKIRTGPEKGKLVCTEWYDPKRGYLPVRMETRSSPAGDMIYIAVVDKIKGCTKGRWFPIHATVVFTPERQSGPLRTRIFNVTELDVEKPPLDDEMSIEVPADTQISELPHDVPAFFTFSKPTRIKVNELAKILDRCQSTIPYWKKQIDDYKESKNASQHTFWFISINLVIGLVVLIRYRKGIVDLFTTLMGRRT